jgi:hypothetical protein
VTSSSGAAVTGIPVRARKANGTFAVSVYTDNNGEYSFPDWADISAGSYAVSITLPDYVHANKDGVALTADKTAKVDFQLAPRTPSV